MASYPSFNDREFDLLKKLTSNTAYIAENGGGGGGAVSSVFARTGAVTALAADYAAFYPQLGGNFGTPSAINLANGTALPISGIAGLGTGVAAALATAVGSAGAPVVFNGAGGVPTSLTLTNANGLPIAGLTGLGTNIGTALGVALNANSGLLGKNSDGSLTLAGAIIRSPAVITLTANAGTLDVTKSYSQVTNNANITLTPSAAGTSGQYVTLDIVNSASSTITVLIDTAADITVTAQASSTTTIVLRSDGSGWILVGGSPSAIDLSAAPASVLYQQTVTNPTTGAVYKLGAYAQRLGSYGTPDTTAGSITWSAAVYEVFTNTTTTYALPAAANYDGKAIIFYVVGTNAITIDPNGSEVIVRDGTAQTGGVTMTLTGVAGNYVCMICDGTRWITLGYKGTLAAGS